MKAITDEFKPIEGFPGYAVSASGEVASFRQGTCRLLKPCYNQCGYKLVRLFRDKIGHMQAVHKLVALAFLGPRPTGYDIDHIDGDKTNNHYTNLRYVTTKENINNPNTVQNQIWHRNRKMIIATKSGVDQVFDGYEEMCRQLGLNRSEVWKCLSYKPHYRTHHGYTFRYKEAQ